MKKILFIILIISLLISSCSYKTITAQPITAKIIENIDPLCKNVICPENRSCKQGTCICNEGKACENQCIPESACCTDSDCNIDSLCVENKCEKQTCSLYETFDRTEGLCVCDNNSKWCSFQQQCIPAASCCKHTDCGFDERCVSTMFTALLCIDDDKKHCKSVIENRRETFIIGTNEYEVIINEILEDNKVRYHINDVHIVAAIKGKYDLENGHIARIEKIDFIGGFCRWDEG